MNRSRINQILGVLLFPITDPGLQKNDYLYERCMAYEALIAVKGNGASVLEEKMRKSKRYRKAEKDLLKYLADSCRSRIPSYDSLQMLCELYYPLLDMERFIEERQQLKQQMGNGSDRKENTAVFYMERMRRIAVSLLTYRDGILAIRTWNNSENVDQKDIFCTGHVFDKVEIWNMLSSYVSPDLFMALFMVECDLGAEALYEQKAYISLPDKLLVKVLRKGMAENHLHFNAAFGYEAVWINKMNLRGGFRPAPEDTEEEVYLKLEAALFRLLSAVFLLGSKAEPFMNWIVEYRGGVFCSVIGALYTGDIFGVDRKELEEAVWEVVDEETVRETPDYLLEAVFNSHVELKTSSEFILLYYCCRYMKECSWDTGFSRVFLQYIRIKNLFVRKVLPSDLVPGLRHFQTYFNQMIIEESWAAGSEKMALDVFRAQSKIAGLKKIEIRIAPDIELEHLCNLKDKKAVEEMKQRLCRQLLALFQSYRKYILESVMGVEETSKYLQREERQREVCRHEAIGEILYEYDEKIKELGIPVLGIIYHFIKTESTDNISGYHCWRDMDDSGKSVSKHRFILRERMILLGIAIEELRQEIPKLNEYVVGVDAASDENAMEPWMFSPAFTRMRSKLTSRPISTYFHGGSREYSSVQNIGFTYHVGEDYRHILSGLRHIDEVIERFYYKPGDRLGHALALGTDIRRWIRETEAAAMPVQEYMEDLLWVWGKIVHGEVRLSVQLEMLEEKILQCAEKIYGSLSGLSVRLLYQAYERKFSVAHKKWLAQLKKEENETPKPEDRNIYEKEKPQTYCKIINAKCIGYEGLWTVERLISTIYCPVFEERGKQVEMVPVRNNELELYEELQEYLQRKVARKGIYIETNPTSNLNIGDMGELLEHPIFRLSPLKADAEQGKSILVTINSDDPAVFNTNVESEFAYVYYALEHAGCAKEDILHWIDKIRQNGMDGSFISKVKGCGTLLEEVSGIMDSLIRFC